MTLARPKKEESDMSEFYMRIVKEVDAVITIEADTRDEAALKVIAMERLSTPLDWRDADIYVGIHEIMAKDKAISFGWSVDMPKDDD
jgi:hypothetical protein